MVAGINFYTNIESVSDGLLKSNYIAGRKVATAVYLAGRLGKPLLIEGPAGVGKTCLAASMAKAMQTKLIRLQCYPGLDESKTLYEWNYQKQLLHIQMHGAEMDIFSDEYLMERPLLKAFRSRQPVVLLVDEIDKSEEELESFLLEALSEYQVSIPEFGTVKATTQPYVVITSNSTRQLGDALKRRCIYLYLDYPGAMLEEAIICMQAPDLSPSLGREMVGFVQNLRKHKLNKAPSITEAIDWARTLLLLGKESLDEQTVRESLNVLLKYEEDLVHIKDKLDRVMPEKIITATNSKPNQPPNNVPKAASNNKSNGALADVSEQAVMLQQPDLSRFDF